MQDFLKWYNNHKDDLQIQLENMKDAVKIMTIHKSKGLQFSSVIIPYAGWQFRIGEGNPLWIYSDDELLKDIPAVQIPFKNELESTIFADEFKRENYKTAIDNLNMLYVALTRAETQMFIYYPVKKEEEKSNIDKALFILTGDMQKANEDVQKSLDEMVHSKLTFAKENFEQWH